MYHTVEIYVLSFRWGKHPELLDYVEMICCGFDILLLWNRGPWHIYKVECFMKYSYEGKKMSISARKCYVCILNLYLFDWMLVIYSSSLYLPAHLDVSVKHKWYYIDIISSCFCSAICCVQKNSQTIFPLSCQKTNTFKSCNKNWSSYWRYV